MERFAKQAIQSTFRLPVRQAALTAARGGFLRPGFDTPGERLVH
jgi:hypothetical protein